MVEVAQFDEELPDVHVLGLSTGVHFLGVGDQRFGEHSENQGESLIKRNHP